MPAEELKSSIILEDNASDTLEDIGRQAAKTAEEIEHVSEALEDVEPPDMDFDFDPDAYEAAAAAIEQAGEAFTGVYDAVAETNKAIEQTKAAIESTQDITSASAQSEKAKPEIPEGFIENLEKELADTIDLSMLETVNEEANKAWAERAEESFEKYWEDVEKESENILNDWADVVDKTEEIPKEAEKAGETAKKSLLDMGANIAGWVNMIKDVFGKIWDIFKKISEEADKLNTRMARYGMVADSEGKTGESKTARSKELYQQQQNYAQALGIGSEEFNETVLNMYSNGAGVVKSIEQAQAIAASSYMAMDIAGLRGADKTKVMGEVQSMVSVGIADPDQIQEAMKIAPNILRTIEQQFTKNLNGKKYKLKTGEEITDATGKIAQLAQDGQITAELVKQAMVNSAQETHKAWEDLPATWEKLQNRAKVIFENMTFEIIEAVGKAADDPTVAGLVTEVLGLIERIVNFIKGYVMPIAGAIIKATGEILTVVISTINLIIDNIYYFIPALVLLTIKLMTTGAAAGIAAGMMGAFKAALMAITAHPLVAVLVVVLGLTIALARLIETNESFQAGMLQATAVAAYSAQQIGTFFEYLPEIFESIIRGIKSYFMSFVNLFEDKIASLLELAASVSETADAEAKKLRASIASRTQEQEAWDKESEDRKKVWKDAFSANTKHFDEYWDKIPAIAKENLAKKKKDDLKLTGFLEEILGAVENIPGTPNNPANVKGKVSIDGKYEELIRRAAGAEIVNRYTTLRPTVHAKFGDIHKEADADDFIEKLGEEIRRAGNAALADAQGA